MKLTNLHQIKTKLYQINSKRIFIKAVRYLAPALEAAWLNMPSGSPH